MAAIFKRLGEIGRGLLESAARFPLETSLGIAYFVLFILADKGILLSGSSEGIWLLGWFVPHYILLFCLHRFSDEHKGLRPLYWLAWFLWIPLIFVKDAWLEWPEGIAWLLAVILLFIGTKPMKNEEFGRECVHTVKGLCTGLLLGGLLALVVMAIIASLDALFNLYAGNTPYIYSFMFISTVIVPLLCCFFVSGKESGERKGRFLQILVDGILSPALLVYAIILYAYLIRILLRWELPEGGVSYLVLSFLAVGLACHLLRLQVEKRHFEWFYKAFPYIAIAPLGLLWTGVFRRVGEYGFTEPRVYLLACAILVTLFVAMLLWERTRNFQLMTLILGVAAILLTYFPGIRSRDFGIRSQQARLEKLLPDILVDGKFPEEYDYDSLDSLQTQKLMEARSAWLYLDREMRNRDFNRLYGDYGYFHLETWRIRENPIVSIDDDEDNRYSFSLDELVDTGEYTWLVPESLYRTRDDDGKVYFYLESDPDDILLVCPFSDRIEQWKSQPGTDVLIYKNDRYMAVFGDITEAKDKSFFWIGRTHLFRKPWPAE